jgi:hypothetical protein
MDIDIDCKTDFIPKKVFKSIVKASMVKEEDLKPHPCGVYFQNIPEDPLLGLSAIPYEQAEDYGYFKVDFLHLGIYDHFESREEIKALMHVDPEWSMLVDQKVIPKLFHVAKHETILKQVKPKSVLDLADCLALIRPQKRYLLDLYLRDKDKARTMLYSKEDGGYGFKKAHAISYAYVIILQLHLINAGIV